MKGASSNLASSSSQENKIMLKDDKYPKPDYYFYKRYFDKKRNRATFVMFRSDTRDQIKASCDLQVLREI